MTIAKKNFVRQPCCVGMTVFYPCSAALLDISFCSFGTNKLENNSLSANTLETIITDLSHTNI